MLQKKRFCWPFNGSLTFLYVGSTESCPDNQVAVGTWWRSSRSCYYSITLWSWVWCCTFGGRWLFLRQGKTSTPFQGFRTSWSWWRIYSWIRHHYKQNCWRKWLASCSPAGKKTWFSFVPSVREVPRSTPRCDLKSFTLLTFLSFPCSFT